MGAQRASHGHHDRKDDNLLLIIAEKERELEAMLNDARQEAAAVVTQARADADRILGEARQQVTALAREHDERMQDETARIQQELLERGAHDVDALRQQAAARQESAARLVIDRVIKGI